MALDAASTIEVRPGSGSDTNGGGAATSAGTNLSLFNSAQYAVTDLVTAGTTTVTSVTANWGTDVVGNWMYVAGGTGSITGSWYKVVTRTSSSSLVLDRTTGLTAGTGATSNIGGALATIGALGALLAAQGAAGMVAWVKNGTNTLSTSTPNVSGGVFTTTLTGIGLFGYNSVRGDLNNSIGSANRPVIDCGALTAITVIAAASNGTRLNVANIKIDGKGNSTVVGFGLGLYSNCTAVNCTTGFTGNTTVPVNCSALVCGTGFSVAIVAINCFSNDCTTSGFLMGLSSSLVNCISINDAISLNLTSGAAGVTLVNCTLHEPTGDAITDAGINFRSINTVTTLPGGDAFDFNNATTCPTTALLINNAYQAGNNLYETAPPSAQISGAITLLVDPYLTEVSDDLAPNNAATGGALLRNTATKINGQVTDNHDVGAPHHADPTSNGGGIFF